MTSWVQYTGEVIQNFTGMTVNNILDMSGQVVRVSGDVTVTNPVFTIQVTGVVMVSGLGGGGGGMTSGEVIGLVSGMSLREGLQVSGDYVYATTYSGHVADYSGFTSTVQVSGDFATATAFSGHVADYSGFTSTVQVSGDFARATAFSGHVADYSGFTSTVQNSGVYMTSSSTVNVVSGMNIGAPDMFQEYWGGYGYKHISGANYLDYNKFAGTNPFAPVGFITVAGTLMRHAFNGIPQWYLSGEGSVPQVSGAPGSWALGISITPPLTNANYKDNMSGAYLETDYGFFNTMTSGAPYGNVHFLVQAGLAGKISGATSWSGSLTGSLQVGIVHTSGAASGPDYCPGEYFLWRSGTSAIQAVTCNTSGITYTDTGVSRNNPGLHKCNIIHNISGARVQFFLNDALVADHTTNIMLSGDAAAGGKAGVRLYHASGVVSTNTIIAAYVKRPIMFNFELPGPM